MEEYDEPRYCYSCDDVPALVLAWRRHGFSCALVETAFASSVRNLRLREAEQLASCERRRFNHGLFQHVLLR